VSRSPTFLFEERDERAKRLAAAPIKPPAPQLPCDIGLFSDDRLQADLFQSKP
jgi:hypothetical protein